jgi:DNA invertase Pin-like site-specific DNA recombinase
MNEQSRAGIYARISVYDEKVAKTANQSTDCEKLAAANGYVVVDRYVDDGISASSGKQRPEWERLMADILAGKLDVIVAVDEDRLYRRVEDKLELSTVCEASGVRWHTVRGGMVDPASEDGEFFSTMRAAMARLEVRKKSARQKATNATRRAEGLPTCQGARPFGFEPDFMTHREDEAELIRELYDRFLRGPEAGKLYGVLRDWNKRGILTARLRDWKKVLAETPAPTDPSKVAKLRESGAAKRKQKKPLSREERLVLMQDKLTLAEARGAWSYAALQKILQRRRNAGLVEHNREIVEGVTARWKPIVPRADWEEACAILGDPERQVIKQREPKHLLSGVATCGVCGALMGTVTASHKGVGELYYRCKSKQFGYTDERRHPAIRSADLDKLARQAVIDSYFVAPNAGLAASAEVENLSGLHTRLAEVRQGLKDLRDLVGTPGFDKANTMKRAKELDDEQAALTDKIETVARRSAHAAMLIEARHLMNPDSRKASLEDAGRRRAELGQAFDALTLEQKRTLIRAIVRVTVYGGRKLEDRVQIDHLAAPVLDLEDAS